MPDRSTDRSTVPWKSLALILLFLTGLILDWTGAIDWHQIRVQLEPVAGQWWLPPLLAGMQIALFALALPGSVLIPVIALLYSPLPATLITVSGSVAGALAARHAALKFQSDWTRQKTSSATYRLLERHSDFFTLCLIRIFPGFPHSVINYGCGLLKVAIGPFALATAVGFTVKNYLYAAVIFEAGRADEPIDLMRIDTFWPLLMVVALLTVGHLFKYYRPQRKGP